MAEGEVVDRGSMISGMERLLALTGQELLEVASRQPDGSFKNFSVLMSRVRTGKSAYESAVEYGFEGTEEEWVKSLEGKSAFQIATETGAFTGSESEWLECMFALYSRDPANAGKVLMANSIGVAEFVELTRETIGLDKVDNTADKDKIISDKTAQALNLRVLRSQMTTEVMKVLLSIPGFSMTPDGQKFVIDASQVDIINLP